MVSVPSGRCGPCCSVAANGNTAMTPCAPSPDSSGQVLAAQSRTGFFSLIAADNAWRDVDSIVNRVNFRARQRGDRPVVDGPFGPKMLTESNNAQGKSP